MTERRQGRDEAGAIAVMFAIFALVMFGLAAFVVDLGNARDLRRQAQNTSDAAALAASNELFAEGHTPDFAAATAAARSYAAQNLGVTDAEWDGCRDPGRLERVEPGGTECISFSEDQPPVARVRLPDREPPVFFAALLGASIGDISALAEAEAEVNGISKCALCVIGQGPHDLQNGDITVGEGDSAGVHFNGNLGSRNNGSITSVGGTIKVEGMVTGGGDFSPLALQDAGRVRDPLAHLKLPIDLSGLEVKDDPCTDGPGRYGGVRINHDCELEEGIYAFTGEVDVGGNADVDATAGVTLYLTCGSPASPRECATGETGGSLSFAGNSSLAIRAPAVEPTAHIAVLSDRRNEGGITLVGGSGEESTWEGTIYAASAPLRMAGNPELTAMDSLIVVDSLDMNGNPAEINLHYTAENNAKTLDGEIYLVQ